jgi:hypothetical protein
MPKKTHMTIRDFLNLHVPCSSKLQSSISYIQQQIIPIPSVWTVAVGKVGQPKTNPTMKTYIIPNALEKNLEMHMARSVAITEGAILKL